MRLSAVVPATNRPPTLPRCLEAIRSASEPPEEIVVVEEPPFAGPAWARNAGAAACGGEAVVFVDADVLVHPDVFTRIRAAFARDPSLVAVFGAYDDAPEAPGTVSVFRNLLHHHVHASAGGEARTFWAGLGAIRRGVFELAGGFDADRYTAPSIEDVELGMRLTASGARIELDPHLRCTHLKAWTLPGMVDTDFRRRGVPWVELLLERRDAAGVLNLGWRHRLSALVCVAGALALVRRRPALAAGSALALVLLNRDFYRLLLERQGPARAAAGVGLHTLHHLTGVAAVPAGAASRVLRSRRSG